MLPEPKTPHLELNLKIAPGDDGKVTFLYEGFRVDPILGERTEIEHSEAMFHFCEFIKHMAIRGEQKTGKRVGGKKPS